MTVAGVGSRPLTGGRSRRVPHISAILRPRDHTVVLAGSAPARATSVPAGTPAGTRRPLPAAVPGWADHDAAVGRITPSQTVPISLTLGWRDQAELTRLIAAVTDPSSSSYGRYLTPATFRARFAPSSQTVAAVTGYLASTGLTVDGVSRNGSRITAHGTAAKVQRAFGTYLNAYRVRGRTLRAAAGTPTLPASIAGAVTAVQGLDQSGAFTTPGATPAPVFRNAAPCSPFFDESATSVGTPDYFGAPVPIVPCGYTSKQLRTAYGLQAGQDGHGVRVGIIDAYASPTIEDDANTWADKQGVPGFADGQLDQSLTPYWLTQTAETDGADPQGWYGEETLDVEAVHGLAPGATVVYAGARDPFDVSLDDTLSDVIDSGDVSIVSNSYGETEHDTSEASRTAFDTIAQEAAATGVGLYFSSGDNGDEVVNTGVKQADYPAGSAWVTAVGGTSLGVGADGQYAFETPWGTDRLVLNAAGSAWQVPDPAGNPGGYTSGGGGGTSDYAEQPTYQQSKVPATLATNYAGAGAPHRVVPDLAAVADPNTGFLVGQTQASPDGTVGYDQYRIGGTSLASPVTAGIMAIVDQGRLNASEPVVGFANPALYAAPTSAYHDVASGPHPTRGVVRTDYVNSVDGSDGLITSLRLFGDTGQLTSTAGYDDTTGLGSPSGQDFVGALLAATK
jgi:subtilase family serine protease